MFILFILAFLNVCIESCADDSDCGDCFYCDAWDGCRFSADYCNFFCNNEEDCPEDYYCSFNQKCVFTDPNPNEEYDKPSGDNRRALINECCDPPFLQLLYKLIGPVIGGIGLILLNPLLCVMFILCLPKLFNKNNGKIPAPPPLDLDNKPETANIEMNSGVFSPHQPTATTTVENPVEDPSLFPPSNVSEDFDRIGSSAPVPFPVPAAVPVPENLYSNDSVASAPSLNTQLRFEILGPDPNNTDIVNSSAPTLTTQARIRVFGERMSGGSESLRNSYIIPSHSVKLGEICGEGSFGKVYKAVWDFQEVAVKVLSVEKLDGKLLTEFLNEVEIMTKLRHPNLLTSYGVCLERGKNMIVMELMNHGTLFGLLQKTPTMGWEQRIQLAADVASGLMHLHKSGVLHRDLKSLNVLITKDIRAKLCDFGLSSLKKAKKEDNLDSDGGTSIVGTIQYMAPELFSGSEFTEKADIFSYAIILWEICCNKIPYCDFSDLQTIVRIVMGGYRLDIPEGAPIFLKDLIKKCWDGVPENRPTTRTILQSLECGLQEGIE